MNARARMVGVGCLVSLATIVGMSAAAQADDGIGPDGTRITGGDATNGTRITGGDATNGTRITSKDV
jgi:hypothetical protein